MRKIISLLGVAGLCLFVAEAARAHHGPNHVQPIAAATDDAKHKGHDGHDKIEAHGAHGESHGEGHADGTHIINGDHPGLGSIEGHGAHGAHGIKTGKVTLTGVPIDVVCFMDGHSGPGLPDTCSAKCIARDGLPAAVLVGEGEDAEMLIVLGDSSVAIHRQLKGYFNKTAKITGIVTTRYGLKTIEITEIEPTKSEAAADMASKMAEKSDYDEKILIEGHMDLEVGRSEKVE